MIDKWTHCPKCNNLLVYGLCETNDHRFHGYSNEESWNFYDKNIKIQVGKSISYPYYYAIIAPNGDMTFYLIDYIAIENCVEFINKFYKLKTFI